MSIQVSSLQKNYGEQKAVNNISFTVEKGQIVGFLGPNGAGKSTTMKILTGYLQADGGRAEVCGRDVSVDPLFTKANIGYLPESNPLYYDMFVREYLHFMASVHRINNVDARVEEVISLVGLQPESDKKIGQLSKGYKQRVGLAAALIHNPEVLILDEPTTGLDPNQIVEIREVIRRLGQEKTILFSTHILQEVEAICDRVIIINKGQLIADNSLADLQSKHSKPLIKVQFKQSIEPEWLRRTIPSLTSLNSTAPGNFEISAPDLNEAKKQLLELSMRENLDIMSLTSGEQTLEDLFRRLTT